MTSIDLSESRALAAALDNFSKTAEHSPAQMDMGDVYAEFAVAMRKHAIKGWTGAILGSLGKGTTKATGRAAAKGVGRAAGHMPGSMANIGRTVAKSTGPAAAPAAASRFGQFSQNMAKRVGQFADEAAAAKKQWEAPIEKLKGLFSGGVGGAAAGGGAAAQKAEAALLAQQAKNKELAESLANWQMGAMGAGGLFAVDRLLGGGGGGGQPPVIYSL